MNLNTQTRRLSRRAIAAIVSLLVLAGLLAATVVPATGAEGDELLPDLVAEPVGQADTTATPPTPINGQTRLLLRFTSYVRNLGAGPLEVTGVNPVNGRDLRRRACKQVLTHKATTRISTRSWTRPRSLLPAAAELKYEETDLHNHWHFQRAARYSLWNDARTAADRTRPNKVGFCFLDIGHGDPNYNPALDDPDPLPVLGDRGAEGVREQHEQLPRAPSVLPGSQRQHRPAADEGRHGHQHRAGVTCTSAPCRSSTSTCRTCSPATTGSVARWTRTTCSGSRTRPTPAVFAAARSTVPGYIARTIGEVNPFQISGVKESTSTITLSRPRSGTARPARRRSSPRSTRSPTSPSTGRS